jgi:hypothetical protein
MCIYSSLFALRTQLVSLSINNVMNLEVSYNGSPVVASVFSRSGVGGGVKGAISHEGKWFNWSIGCCSAMIFSEGELSVNHD